MIRATRTRADRGQATVELALALPIVCLLLLAVVQLAVVVANVLAVQQSARNGARAAAVASDTSGSAATAVGRPGGLTPRVGVAGGGGVVTVTVTVRVPTDVPLVGRLLPDVTVASSASMPREPP